MNTIKKHPRIAGVILVAIIIIIIIVAFGGKKAAEQTLIIKRTDFSNEISVSGKVVAAQSADLGFDQSGRIASINAQVGDKVMQGSTIASIDNITLQADVAQKAALLEKEQAKLASLQKGTREEELTLYQQKYTDASAALGIAMRNAYLQTESAILAKADTIFSNGNSVNPLLTIPTQSDNEKRATENERLIVTEKLAKWKTALATLSPTPTNKDISAVRSVASDTTQAVKIFFDHLSSITGNLSPGSSGMTQSSIDTVRATVNSGSQQASTAAASDQDVYTSWSSAYNSLVLQQSGTRSEDIPTVPRR